MDGTGPPITREHDDVARSPLSSMRHKRPLSSLLPNSGAPSSSASPNKAHHPSVQGTGGDTSVVNITPTSLQGGLAEAPNTTAAATNTASPSTTTPWDLSLREGLDFCRDGDALLRQIYQRIEATCQQLVDAALLPSSSSSASSGDKGDETTPASGSSGVGKGEAKLMEHQNLLKEEIDDCLAQIQELRRLLLSTLSLIKSNPIFKDTAKEADGGPRGEAVMKAMKLFRLDSTAGEILPYLKHLQNSLKELQQQEEQTAEKTEEVKQRINLKLKEVESVKFCLEKTKDEFRQARLDLTREELEKIPAKERLQLLETKRENLDRELRSLAAFSPLFIVERAAKYITLQYRPDGSSIDYEISIEGLDLSFAQGSSRLSRFFSVHIQPPNDRVRRLLESGIGELLQKLSSQQHPNQGREHAKGRQTGDGGVEAAGDKVVEYIAAILIKTLSASFTTPSTAPRYLPLVRASPSLAAIQTN
ncbi:non-muscle myosin heavy chain, putative [Eimeria maxima]|uniref:Non-muscle myosin heavy chain, putative n=1 Tax=Eimeria maxima TaxID=5804 RepID=U6M8C6_EIMMA|nr:non-muscle myosin heavy chain, putative [Eimeria maxima]CDJ60276.1 non-muscle myosin heavy chain, putative [Eimeria maxima]